MGAPSRQDPAPETRDAADAMLDIAGVLLAYTDREFVIRHANRPLADWMGVAPEALVGRSCLDIARSAENRELFEHCRASRMPVERREVPVLHPGEPPEATRYWDWSLLPVLDAHGEATGFVGRALDVTAKVLERERRLADERKLRRDAERALAEASAQRAMLDSVLENLPVGIGIAEAPSGRLVRVNEETRRIWRMDAMEAADGGGCGKFAGFHPDGRPYASEDWQLVRALNGEVIRGEEVVFVRGDGTRSVMRSNAGPVRGPDGEIIAAIVIIDDIAEQRLAKDALRRVRERAEWLARFPEENPEPVLRLSGDLVVSYCNRGSEALAGLGVQVGHPAPEALAAPARKALAEGGRRTVELECSGRTFSLFVVPAGGEVNVYGRDVTDRRIAEKALQTANEALLDADRRKDEFLAVLSHELRNPLAPIRSSLYVLERAGTGDDRGRRAMAVIERQARQLSRLVDDLLDVTRVVRGKIRLRTERADLAELVRSAVEDHRGLFARAGVELAYDPGSPVFVDADASRLAQVVGNLLQNAAKFTPRDGRVRVEVRAGERAEIRVTDTGAGMTAETLARIFEPFMQADTTLDRSRGGLGLGLALAKGLAELHGGGIRAHSEGPGLGAEFVVWIPVARPRAPEPAPVRAAAPGARRVLVVEDNVDAAQSLRDALELDGHEVAVAGTGPEGLAMARGFAPQVLLCDLGLPGMDGFDVARAFRADGALSGTYLVALSGYAGPEDLRRSREAGFDRHLAKPPTVERLEEVLAEAPAAGAPG